MGASNKEAIDGVIKVLQGHFQVQDPTSLEDYFGVRNVQSDDGKKAWLGQPTIIKSLEKQFGENIVKKKMTITPGTPGFIVGKVDDTLRVKVIPGRTQKHFSFTQAMLGGLTIQDGQTKQGELFIALAHEDQKHIIFDRVLKAGNSVLLAAKMVIRNPEEVNAVIVNGKQSKEYFHRVT